MALIMQAKISAEIKDEAVKIKGYFSILVNYW